MTILEFGGVWQDSRKKRSIPTLPAGQRAAVFAWLAYDPLQPAPSTPSTRKRGCGSHQVPRREGAAKGTRCCAPQEQKASCQSQAWAQCTVRAHTVPTSRGFSSSPPAPLWETNSSSQTFEAAVVVLSCLPNFKCRMSSLQERDADGKAHVKAGPANQACVVPTSGFLSLATFQENRS